MKCVLRRYQQIARVTLTSCYSNIISSHRHGHSPAEENPHNSTCRDGNTLTTSSSTSTVVSLNALSSAVRRFFLSSPGRWWETPGSVVTLMTILLNHKHSIGDRDDSELHPLLGVEILKGLGCAVWVDSDGGLGGWAARSRLAAERLSKLAACVVQPLLPLVATHTKVKPLLPVLVEWLICISDIPLQMWLSHLTLYVDHLSAPKMTDGVSYYCKGPPADFLLFHLMKRLPPLEGVNMSTAVSEELEQVLDKILPLLLVAAQPSLEEEGKQEHRMSDDVTLPTEVTSYGIASYPGTTDCLAKCLFWKGDVPLLLHDIIRGAYKRLCQSKGYSKGGTPLVSTHMKQESLPLLSLSITSDDEFRRLLLRLSASSHFVKIKTYEVDSSNNVVLIEPLLRMEDPLVILRFILPLSEFVAEMIDSDNCNSGVLSMMRLSFDGVRSVIYGAIGALHQLQRDSKPARYVLLPHKPRIHALKSLCERLLSHLQGCERGEEQQKSNLFPGVPLQQQIYILSSFHRATRRLVAAVMLEKTSSLLEEGSEGSVLHAGGVMTGNNDITSVLRNMAFRVLEVSLLRYYKSLNELSFFSNERHNEGHNESEYAIRLREEIAHHAGGRAMLFTVRHILQHPLSQDVTAVAEGLRLVAIQSLVLRSPECEEWLGENYNGIIANAFFSVWHRTIGGGSSETSGKVTAPLVGESSKEEGSHTALRVLHKHMCERLLWTMLLLHQRYCCCTVPSHEEPLEVDKKLIFSCSLFRSLLDLLTSHDTCTEFTGFGWFLSSKELDVTFTGSETKERLNGIEWSQQIVYPPFQGGENAGYLSRWEMQEELSLLDNNGGGKWRWLGTVGAVSEAVSFAKSAIDAGRNVGYAGYLLPWSTVVQSRHPLRLYDESGESAGAALKFDVDVEKLLSLRNGSVVRLVSIAEETRVFRDMMYTSQLQLGTGVVIDHPEAHRLGQVGSLLHSKHRSNDNDEDDDDDDRLD